MIRSAAVAGSFYPAEPAELQNQISQFLTGSRKTVNDRAVKMLLVPHAGYPYSGQVAAEGFKQIEGAAIDKVILIGPSHHSWFTGAAIDESDRWQTPLGEVEIDKTLAQSLIDEEEDIFFSSQPHIQEHCLEVEVPFLQTTLKKFKIVPIILGSVSDQLIERLADLIAQNMDSKALLLVSTDLSHYPDYQTATQVDQKTIESILSGDQERFTQTISQEITQGYPGLETCACGEKAVRVAMLAAQKLGPGEWRLIKYANSGDVDIGDKNKVVGYAAIVWVKKEKPEEKEEEKHHAQEERKTLLRIARETLESYLKNKEKPKYQIDNPRLNEKLGVFVTLNKKGHQLRGCIGEFQPVTPLWQTVQNKAIDAALNDPRFPPVRYEELKEIEIEISLLSPPRKITDWREIEPGKHGVILKQGSRGGTFLPQVATETGWDREEFLSQLCLQKAGLPEDCYKDPKTELFVYTAEVFSESDVVD